MRAREGSETHFAAVALSMTGVGCDETTSTHGAATLARACTAMTTAHATDHISTAVEWSMVLQFTCTFHTRFKPTNLMTVLQLMFINRMPCGRPRERALLCDDCLQRCALASKARTVLSNPRDTAAPHRHTNWVSAGQWWLESVSHSVAL